MTGIAAERLKVWREHPSVFVKEVLGITPDPWQHDVLEAFPHNQRLAMVACKGPGKTAVLAWMMWNFMLTRPFPKIAATSITGDNLADGLWTELAVCMGKSRLLKDTFTYTKTRIFSNDHPETWFMSARPWSKSADSASQGNTLAGLHADYILFILDESAAIPDAVMAAADAALSSCIEGHIVQAGNPTNLSGPLYRAATTERRLWHLTNITGDPDDPKRSPRVKIEWANAQIEKYGRNNPFVLVSVFGQFPPSAFNSLIGVDEVEAAMKRDYRENVFKDAARVLGIDVARDGADSSIIFPVQGLQAFTPMVYRNIDGTAGANLTARKWREWNADACFIDDTGGFGASWIDNLRRLGFSPIGVHFAEKADNPRYANKRTEMIFECVEWIKRGAALPYIPELLAALTQTTYTFDKQGSGDKLIIEPKALIKAKLGYSPDHLDSLALTRASPVIRQAQVTRNHSHTVHYDSLSLDYLERDLGVSKHDNGTYNPGW